MPTPRPSWQQRIVAAATSPEGKVGAAAGVGGLVLGLLLGLCFGGDAEPAGDGSVPVAGVTTTLPPLGEAFDATTTTAAGAGENDEADAGDQTAPSVDRNPLNGAALDAQTSRRVVAVKVDNVAPALPQVGISDAEMIIEVPVEGGLTRFTALFFDPRPSEVGSVRSIRPVDADLLAPLTPVLMSTGGRDFVERLFGAAGITMVPDEAEDAYRPLNRPPPHDVFALLDGVDRFAGNVATTEGLFAFGEGFESARDVGSVSIPFSAEMDVVWRFEDGAWVRVQNGETHMVIPNINGSPEPLTTDTIVVIQVAERSAGYVDTAGTDVPTYDVIGFGDAMVLSAGGVIEGRWLRAAQEDPYVLVDATGQSIQLPPGRVFLEVVPRFVEIATS